MDSRRFPNFGDAEFTPRLKRAGYKLIIDPRSRVFCQPNAIPKRLRDKSATKLFRELILDLKHPANLTRVFLSHVSGGPSVFQGILAFVVLLAKTGLQALRSGNSEVPTRREPPLTEVFASYVLDRK